MEKLGNKRMIKKINIAGIELDNYTVRESIMQVENMLCNNSFNTVVELTMPTIFDATADEVLRETIESVDHTIIADTGILAAANKLTMQRKYEIEGEDFFFELLKRIERGHKTVFFIGENEEEISAAREFIEDEYPKCEIVGAEVLSDMGSVCDAVINEVNALTPDVIISLLPEPQQAYFLHDHKDKLSANLWYGIGSGKFQKRKHRLIGMIQRQLRIGKLSKQIHLFNMDH